MTIAAGSIEEAVACAALFGRVILSAHHLRLLQTADLIAREWVIVSGLPLPLLTEAARAFVTAVNDAPEVVPVREAMATLLQRTTKERALYGWPEVDAETVDAMAVRAAVVWLGREGE